MLKRTIWLYSTMSTLALAPALGQNLISDADLAGLGYYTYWRAHLPLRAGEQLDEMHLVDGRLFAITSDKILYSLRGELGTISWSVRMGGRGARVFQPSHVRSFWGRDLALVATSDRLVWLEDGSGAEVARLELPFVPTTSAVSDGVRVYVGGMDQLLHCFEFVSRFGSVSTIEKWRVRAPGQLSGPPVLWDGGLYFASKDGRVRSCDSRDKTRFWSFRAPAAVDSDIHVDSTGVYFACGDQRIYKLDVNTGKADWRVIVPGKADSSPLLVGDLLIQGVSGWGLFAFDADTGSQVWHAPAAREFIAASSERIFLWTQIGDVIAVNLDTVQIDAQVFAGDIDLVAPNTANSAMYFADRGGSILCAQQTGVPYLRFEQLEQASASRPAEPGVPAHRVAPVESLDDESDD